MIFLKKIKFDVVSSSIALIIMGLIFIFNPYSSANVLCLSFGIVLMFLGLSIVWGNSFYGYIYGGYPIIFGILATLLGILCISNPAYLANLLSFITGLILLNDGICSCIDSIKCKKMRLEGWGFILLLSLVTIAIGIYILLNPTVSVIQSMGYALIVDGVCDLLIVWRFSKSIQKARKNHVKDNLDYIDVEYQESDE